jgi:polysaccharide export outer membrane protein
MAFIGKKTAIRAFSAPQSLNRSKRRETMRMKLLTFGLLLACAGPLMAQESLPIGPGDLLHVTVFDTPELDQHTRVSDNGNLHLTVGGEVHVGGMTAGEAGHAIESALLERNIMKHPQVLVSIEDFASEKVSILGDVHVPGAYPITTSRTVLDVLSLAGGLLDSANRHIVIQRHATGEKVTYFLSNDPGVAIDTVVKVYPGDTVLVPKADLVYAIGDFHLPGAYTVSNNESKLTVLELLAHAGGAPATADTLHARLIHRGATGYTEEKVPLYAMMRGKSPDIALRSGDILYVPFSFGRNTILGASQIIAAAGQAAIYTNP